MNKIRIKGITVLMLFAVLFLGACTLIDEKTVGGAGSLPETIPFTTTIPLAAKTINTVAAGTR